VEIGAAKASASLQLRSTVEHTAISARELARNANRLSLLVGSRQA